MAAASRVPLLEEQQRVAEQLAAEAKAALKAREQQLEAAANEFEAAVAKAKELEEAAEVARAQAGLERKKQKTAEADAEPTWSLAKWNELETKEQTRRAVEIDESKTDRALPPGRARFGEFQRRHTAFLSAGPVCRCVWDYPTVPGHGTALTSHAHAHDNLLSRVHRWCTAKLTHGAPHFRILEAQHATLLGQPVGLCIGCASLTL